MKKQVMTITFDNITMEEAVGVAMGHIAARSRCRVVTPNAEFALEAKKNPRFLNILNTSQLVLADGISVVLASKIIGNPMQGRVTGVGFAQALAAAMAEEGKSLYLLGAKPGVAEQAAGKLLETYPGLKIAGTKDGLLGIVRPDGSVYNLGNCAPYGPVRCMTTNADKTELFGVAGDEEDMGMVFHYDDMRGISQVGHLNYNSPNHMDGPSSANVLSCIAVSKDGKNVAIGNIDRMGCIHIADLAAMRIE